MVAPELVIQAARADEVVDCGDGDGHGAVTAALPRSLCRGRRDEVERAFLQVSLVESSDIPGDSAVLGGVCDTLAVRST